MRVMFCTTTGAGHVLPLISTAWALRAAGHEVLFALTRDGAGYARDAGMPVAPVTTTVDAAQVFERHGPAIWERLAAAPGDPVTEYLAYVPPFAEISADQAESTIHAARMWRAELIVHTLEHGGGPLAAAVLDVPAVVHGFGFATPVGVVHAVADQMGDQYERYGVSWRPPAAVLDVAPPSLRTVKDWDDAGVPVWDTRYTPYGGGAVLDDWLLEPPARPRIVLTLGTSLPGRVGLDPLAALIEAAEGVDAEFVLLLGDTLADTGGLPPNVRVVGWTPLDAVLRTADAVVNHGGSGTVLSCLAAGLPQLVLPQWGDQSAHGAAVRERGAGLVSSPAEAGVWAVTRLITDAGMRDAARAIRDEMAAMAAPARIAGRLADLAR